MTGVTRGGGVEIVASEETFLLSASHNDKDTSIVDASSQHTEGDLHVHHGKASFAATVINLMKTCMGTGTLALPFACQQGGIILHSVGLLGIAMWNLYSVHRLCQALRYLKANNPTNAAAIAIPPQGLSTFGKVAWFAFGKHGVHGLDMLLVILFLGIIVAYQDAVLGFLEDTPFNTGYKPVNAFIIAAVIGTLSLVPDMGYLAKASASGLIVLVLAFVAITFYAIPSDHIGAHLSLWPRDGFVGASNWFGCVVFGFGVVPLTYNYYESMARPQLLTSASMVALLGVAICYMVVGCGLALRFYPVQGDVMEQLPSTGYIPLLVRLAMIVVVILTCPLIVLPCGQILEEKLNATASTSRQAMIRYTICAMCAIVSVSIPGFVYVLSFVGCFSVALVGFVVPPLLHIALVYKYKPSATISSYAMDLIMLSWGVTATIISSSFTLRKLQGK